MIWGAAELIQARTLAAAPHSLAHKVYFSNGAAKETPLALGVPVTKLRE